MFLSKEKKKRTKFEWITLILSVIALVLSGSALALNVSHELWTREMAEKKAVFRITIQPNGEVNFTGIKNYLRLEGTIENIGEASGQLFDYSLYVDSGGNRVSLPISFSIEPTFHFLLLRGETKSFVLVAQFELLPSTVDKPYTDLSLTVDYTDGNPKRFGDVIAYLSVDASGTITEINPAE